MTLNYNAVPFEMNQNRYYQRQDGIILSTPKPDWNQIILSNFEKNFYNESSIVQNRSIVDIQHFLINNQITIDGNAPRPIFYFNEINFPGKIFFHQKNKS